MAHGVWQAERGAPLLPALRVVSLLGRGRRPEKERGLSPLPAPGRGTEDESRRYRAWHGQGSAAGARGSWGPSPALPAAAAHLLLRFWSNPC